jgi:hypothetical protein
MRFTNLMIDLETLGTAVNAPVVALGACYFDPDTGEIGSTFDAAIKLSEAMRYGRASGETFAWWLEQSDEARRKVARGRHESVKVFEAFEKFCLKHGDNVKPWANGSSFDISILEYSFMRILERPAPWKFWNIRDCRTIKELADGIVQFNGERKGVHHSALDDAIFQAEWVSAYWQGLRGIKKTAAPSETEEIDDLLG